MNDTVRLHQTRIAPPPDGEAFTKWVALEDGPSFLRADLQSADLAVYSGVGDVFMHAVLVPTAAVNPPDYKDLME